MPKDTSVDEMWRDHERTQQEIDEIVWDEHAQEQEDEALEEAWENYDDET